MFLDEKILENSTKGVRPSNLALRVYNLLGSVPFKLGTLLFLISIDALKVTLKASRGKTDAAIQVIYDYRFRWWRGPFAIGDLIFVGGSYNCRSVRSRGELTRAVIEELTNSNNNDLPIVSLGSGSAKKFMEGINKNSNARIILVDNDLEALERGRLNARQLGLEDRIVIECMTIGHFLSDIKLVLYIIEMVGLADYFSNDKMQAYIKGIYRALAAGGYFVGANISHKDEFLYAHNVAWWPPMYYRSKEDIISLLESGGFQREKIHIFQCGLYYFWIAQK